MPRSTVRPLPTTRRRPLSSWGAPWKHGAISGALCALAAATPLACGSSASDGGAAATSGGNGLAGAGNPGASSSGAGGRSAGAAGAGGARASAGAPSSADAGASIGGAAGAVGVAGAANGGAGQAGSVGAAGAGAAGAGAGAAGQVSTDYPYCDYGSVPSGTPPAAWEDSPTLTPTGVNPFGKPALTLPGGYILLNEGAQGSTQVPTATQQMILKRINDDLKFEIQYANVHLPPWTTGGAKHYIDYLFVGTGFPSDPNAGGDSSYEGQYPDVETMAVAMTDQSQRYDLTHEFNHVLENAYGTIPGEKVSWIEESYNDFLILLVAERDKGITPGQAAQFKVPSNISYLDALTYQQPFVPIESCGVAVKDGSSVTGPGDYFQDVTGFRYNDLFPLFVAQRVGAKFFSAVWENAKASEQILQTMARLLDTQRVQCMVGEYAARLALGDFVEFSSSMQSIGSDPAMYAATSTQDGYLVPTSTAKLPRYTGRNNIPISVPAGATQVSVDFVPDAAGSKGTPAVMQIQLVYRASDGTAVYGAPVKSGTASLALGKAPKNGTVIAVVTNITLGGFKTAQAYGWDPNETFGYKLKVTGGTAAPINKVYF